MALNCSVITLPIEKCWAILSDYGVEFHDHDSFGMQYAKSVVKSFVNVVFLFYGNGCLGVEGRDVC